MNKALPLTSSPESLTFILSWHPLSYENNPRLWKKLLVNLWCKNIVWLPKLLLQSPPIFIIHRSIYYQSVRALCPFIYSWLHETSFTELYMHWSITYPRAGRPHHSRHTLTLGCRPFSSGHSVNWVFQNLSVNWDSMGCKILNLQKKLNFFPKFFTPPNNLVTTV